MRLTLLCVGAIKSGPERELVDDYLKRFESVGRSIGLRSISEIEVASGQGRDAEADRLLAKLPERAQLLRLDEHGPAWPSMKLATAMARWRDDGVAELAFLIGGAEGYGGEIISAVPNTLAFGPQTWPHKLVRVMLAEQIYRAATILAGSPYHKA